MNFEDEYVTMALASNHKQNTSASILYDVWTRNNKSNNDTTSSESLLNHLARDTR